MRAGEGRKRGLIEKRGTILILGTAIYRACGRTVSRSYGSG